MKGYFGIIINATFISLFYIIRCLVLNVNGLFNLVLFIEVVVVVGLMVSVILKDYRTKAWIKITAIHIFIIVSFFLFVGHLMSVMTLYLHHLRAIEVFRKNQSIVPVADRVNGEWILQVPEFSITDQERGILQENFSKSSPCFFERGYCYFELGGFLNNSGGYCLQLNDGMEQIPGSFGFHRIDKTVGLIGNWRYYK